MGRECARAPGARALSERGRGGRAQRGKSCPGAGEAAPHCARHTQPLPARPHSAILPHTPVMAISKRSFAFAAAALGIASAATGAAAAASKLESEMCVARGTRLRRRSWDAHTAQRHRAARAGR